MRLKTYKGASIALFKKTSEGYSILLGKRTINPGKGKWSIFGGKSETFDKTTFETAKREFTEESGIIFETINSKSCGKYNFNFPDFF